MRSVDTNVVVRYLIADDEEQFIRARRLFENDQVMIPASVMLESEWVLRSVYGLARDVVITALRRLCGQDGVEVQDAAVFLRAVDLAEGGLDLADALHLAGSTGCTDFVSFDRRLARRAAALQSVPVVEP